ncbi:MAG: UvrD-helicase domain-containing protein [Ottowia sp.]|nr:UvrD-helicase domain-containing protein [Ottowia sp.]
MPDLLTYLNPEQREAVTLPAQPALILAGAGSGKTRVLTTRIAWLIETGQVSPSGVLAVTFTNKAAKSMLLRLSTMVPVSMRTLWMGTFHGLCHRMLRAHYRDANLPATFQILDMQDQLAALKRMLRGLNVDEEKHPAKRLQGFINSAKEQGLRAGDIEVTDHTTRTSVEFYEAYQTQCLREGVVDFAELLLRCYELLHQHEVILTHYQQRFRHVLVDEFQDTNRLQYAWLKLLSGYGKPTAAAVFAVGDDDQSIYGFRGAEVENMRHFEQQFHPVMVKLEQNYRSHGHILDAANHLIAHNNQRLGKNLRTDAVHGELVRVMEAGSDGQEAAWLVDEIRQLIGQGHASSEIAILYRSNAQSRVIEHALFSAAIPYRVYGGLRFFERAEIKHALAYLRLMENPDDDTAFMRVVNFPTRGIGARSLEHLQAQAKERDVSLFRAIAFMPGGKTSSALLGFVRLLEKMCSETKVMPLPDVVTYVVTHSGLLTHYQNEREGQERVANLDELTNAANAFFIEETARLNGQDVVRAERKAEVSFDFSASASMSQATMFFSESSATDAVPDAFEGVASDAALTEDMTPLAAFLSHASLEAGDHQVQLNQDAVQMMTVHAAKGLEFIAVFVTGLEEGLFPHENSAFEASGLEEERRLMYVAITRARARLYLSFAQTRMLHGQVRYNLRSRFLDELPEESLKWLTPRRSPEQGFAAARWRSDSTSAQGWGRNKGAATQESSLPKVASHTTSYVSAEGVAHYVGQEIFHNKFGEGAVIAIEGRDENARAHIRFKRHGLKWLALSVAKLTAIN